MIFKCKPVFNFQSIEFEYEIDINSETYDEELAQMFCIYADMLSGLKNIAPEQGKVNTPNIGSKPKEELASDAQKNLLKKLGLPYDDDITKKEAFNMIKSAQGGK